MPNSNETRAVTVEVFKGGYGKTAIAVNTGRAIAERDYRTLVIDTDPNGHATTGLGFGEAYHADEHLEDVLFDGLSPEEIIVETDYGFDLLPSHEKLGATNRRLSVDDVLQPTAMLKNNVVDPLLGDVYDFILIDTSGERSKIADNALAAAPNMLIPVAPGAEEAEAIGKTMRRHYKKLDQVPAFDVEILAVVPNMLGRRIDQGTKDRNLLEHINTSEIFGDKVPNFARITQEEFKAIDANEMRPPKPGIRTRDAITNAMRDGKPLMDHDPSNDQLSHFDELAEIVINGGIQDGE